MSWTASERLPLGSSEEKCFVQENTVVIAVNVEVETSSPQVGATESSHVSGSFASGVSASSWQVSSVNLLPSVYRGSRTTFSSAQCDQLDHVLIPVGAVHLVRVTDIGKLAVNRQIPTRGTRQAEL